VGEPEDSLLTVDDGLLETTDEPFETTDEPFEPEIRSIAMSVGVLRRHGGRRAAARLAELAPARYAVAEVVDLVAAGGHLSVGDVARLLALARSRASALVRQARDAGWLAAEPNLWDARITVLSVTESGRQVVEVMQAHRCALAERATLLWSADDRATLARLLARFVDPLDRPLDW
jgi:DNA-binding MarR family transcriptional regulator